MWFVISVSWSLTFALLIRLTIIELDLQWALVSNNRRFILCPRFALRIVISKTKSTYSSSLARNGRINWFPVSHIRNSPCKKVNLLFFWHVVDWHGPVYGWVEGRIEKFWLNVWVISLPRNMTVLISKWLIYFWYRLAVTRLICSCWE